MNHIKPGDIVKFIKDIGDEYGDFNPTNKDRLGNEFKLHAICGDIGYPFVGKFNGEEILFSNQEIQKVKG